MGTTKQCQLKVKRIEMENEVPNVVILWKFDKETGTIYFKSTNQEGITTNKRVIAPTNATRDYNHYM